MVTMKKLKKFNENWIDDEVADTDRRMSELDNEEGNNSQSDFDDKVQAKLLLKGEILEMLNGYIQEYEYPYTDIELLKHLFNLD